MAEREPDDLHALLPAVYTRLYDLAKRLHRRHGAGDAIRPTSVLHEAVVRLLAAEGLDVRDPVHAAAVASQAMRWVLVDAARRANADRRGGGWTRITLTGIGEDTETVDLLALDEALQALAALDPRGAEVVQLRFFGGLEMHEIAELHGVSTRTTERDWRAARAWLAGRLGGPGGVG